MMILHACSTVRRHAAASALLAAAFACLAVASPALARINPLKKAKDAATKSAEHKTEPQSADEQVVFDEYTLELTDARIEAILAACKKAADAVAAKQPFVDQLNKTSDERSKLDQKQGEAVRDLQRKRGDVEVCYHDGYNEFIEKKRKEFAAKAATDPAALQEFSRIAQEQAMAQAKNDSVALQKATAALMKMGAPTREDTLAVKKKCGPIPPHSAAEDQLAAYDTQIAAVNDQIRQADAQVAKAQAKANGMNPEQWATARERILSFLGAYKPKGPEPKGFSEAEVDAMEKHLQQLSDAQKGGCL